MGGRDARFIFSLSLSTQTHTHTHTCMNTQLSSPSSAYIWGNLSEFSVNACSRAWDLKSKIPREESSAGNMERVLMNNILVSHEEAPLGLQAKASS